ncbi:hypothetical protein M409DRAFT_27203 [Zasmidium cellare ATCC 36951]|uniref:Uncharacterized protein n=1 Tax=Zasmidium cellare ATCC 36951 TaxID=1080233 RepID=A0A6A6C9L2_ZASCE|nr:uncharacterized protein M409DRAFT_27203 [Zasmidium cellare ATCC 36951]KAF2162582.1 hypothetical protein M409DRAFT_27203 [Zasmidium cellare ATCC 36951]
MNTLLTTLALAGAATARIVGLAAPATIAPNSNITLTLITENYIQSVKDLSAAFALSPQITNGFLGTQYLNSFYLGPDKSNVLNNLTFTVTTPSDISSVKYITGAVNSLYGASNGPVTLQFDVPTTPGTETSDDLNADVGGTNGNCFASNPSDPTPPGDNSTTPPISSGQCDTFPTQTQTLIQSSLVRADAWIGSIAQNNNQTGRQSQGEFNGALGDVFRAIDVNRRGEQACNNPPPPAQPPLSPGDAQVRAIQILRDAESGLQVLQSEVIQCDASGAFNFVCQVLRLVDQLDTYYS